MSSTVSVQQGDVIVYRLLASQRPTNPDREWTGVVRRVYTPAVFLVVLLEERYRGEFELVQLRQVVRVDQKAEQGSAEVARTVVPVLVGMRNKPPSPTATPVSVDQSNGTTTTSSTPVMVELPPQTSSH